jgi:hypothetical protein
MSTTSADREAILRTVEGWAPDEQVTLARAILERAAANSRPSTAQPSSRSTWDALYGIALSGDTAPSDEQVAQWLDEHRMEKYGR